jgi:beta-mannosidase
MAEVIPIAEGWRVADFAPGGGLTAGVHQPAYVDTDWLEIAVPGDVHRALIAAGRIPDPYYDRNETACAWMEQREWWYRVWFAVPAGLEPLDGDERLRLIFEGLDTFATVYLNGEELGQHRNMFRPAEFDVGARVHHGARNCLAVRFDPPLQQIAGKKLSDWGRNPERSAMRKAQFGFGWDWGPRLPTVGIWRPVSLRQEKRAALTGVRFATLDLSSGHGRAAVAVQVEVERLAASAPLVCRIRLTGPSGETAGEYDLALHGAEREATAYLSVDRPRLWWTHELGEPAHYDLSVALLDNEAVLDRDTRKVGIRTLALDQAPDPAEPATRFFRFVLNGQPLFAKGTNWIPCDSFVGAIPPERRTGLLEMARDANMTMLRVWGGGIYEDDHFYDECDRLGLLVWQDFMFACAMYDDQDPELVAEVEAEARFQIRRLRSHPSLALWCGNNENQWLHERKFWDHHPLPPYGALLYDQVLPRAVAELDGQVPYWPGSPFGGSDHNSELEGDVHDWSAWHGNFRRQFGEQPRNDPTPENVSSVRYADDMGRFISEFGLHAAPVLETLERVVPPDQRHIHSPSLDWHNKDIPKNKGDNLLLTTTGLPQGLEQYITFSQIAQAEGLKFGVEHFRRRKPHCSGTLVWQFDDCWPVLSWSIVDYYGFPKASYFYLRRAYAPILASFKPLASGDVELWLTNDLQHDASDRLTVRLSTFGGQLVRHEAFDVCIGAGDSRAVRHWSAHDVGGAADRCLSVHSATDAFPANRHFFAPYKDLHRVARTPAMTVVEARTHRLTIRLQAPTDGYVYFAHLNTGHETTRYSDNFIDLEPGETRDLVLEDDRHQLNPDTLEVRSA